MQDSRRLTPFFWIGIVAAGYTTLVALVAWLQAFGVGIVPCIDQCYDVAMLPVSKPLSVLAVLFAGSQIYLLLSEKEKFLPLVTWPPALVTLATFGYLASNKLMCTVCVALGCAFWATALLSHRKWIVAVPGFIAVAYSALWIAAYFSPPVILVSKEVAFERRSYEPEASYGDSALVVFSDPQCPACRTFHRQMKSVNLEMAILYRWRFLPQNLPASLDAALLIEKAFSKSPGQGRQLMEVFYSLDQVLDSDAVAGIARGYLSDTEISQALSTENTAGLTIMAADGALADGLSIIAVPMLFVSYASGLGELKETLRPVLIEHVLDGDISDEDLGLIGPGQKE